MIWDAEMFVIDINQIGVKVKAEAGIHQDTQKIRVGVVYA